MRDSSSSQHPSENRREFLLAGAGISAATLAALNSAGTAFAADTGADPERSSSLISPGDVVLFQGDSITDAGRSRENADQPNSPAAMGNGYAWLAAAQLLIDNPAAGLKFFNRGISGNKVYQLAERWQPDCLDIQPNVLSVLIGVNDFWHKLKHGYDGTLEKYEADFDALLKGTRDALPDVKLVVCEPFVLRIGHVDDSWFPQFDEYRAAAHRVAEKAGAIFVPFQQIFDVAVKFAPPEHWAADGVHPTANGAALMAHSWLKAIAA